MKGVDERDMYVNYGLIKGTCDYLIAYVEHHIDRIHYRGRYNDKENTFYLSKSRVVLRGNYPPSLLQNRKLSAFDIKRGY